MEQGEIVALNRGDAARAVLASSAVPGLYAPVRARGRLLADGAEDAARAEGVIAEKNDIRRMTYCVDSELAEEQRYSDTTQPRATTSS